MFSAIYRYRGFIIDSVKRDFQSRYQTSFFGGRMADFTACCHDFRLYADLFGADEGTFGRYGWPLCLQHLSLFGSIDVGIVYRNA